MFYCLIIFSSVQKNPHTLTGKETKTEKGHGHPAEDLEVVTEIADVAGLEIGKLLRGLVGEE